MPKPKSKTINQASHQASLWKVIGLLFISWRIALLVLGAVAHLLLAYQPSFPYAEAMLLNRGLPIWLASWANFDGVHYLTIVEKGYVGTGLIQAFFPLYPGLIWILTLIKLDPLVSGFILSNVFFVLFLAAMYAYVAQTKDLRRARWTCLAIILFPTSFFFGATYTESLFLLLVVVSLWAGQEKKWWLASLAAALASSTRLVGVFLVPALLLELVQAHLSSHQLSHPWRNLISVSFWVKLVKQEYQAISLILLGIAGLLAYMAYLGITFNDPLYFYHVQSEFGSGRQESIVLLPQVFWRYTKILLTYRPFDLKYYAFVQELASTLLAYGLVLIASKKARWSFTLFALLALTLPTLTGTLSSMPRYALAALPIFLFLGHQLTHGSWRWKWWLLISTLLLGINTLLFIQGYWVA
jgi:Gpi18-like mannosyltransferase